MTQEKLTPILVLCSKLSREELLALRDELDFLIFSRMAELEKFAMVKGLGWRPR